jgi:hypothetical protein
MFLFGLHVAGLSVLAALPFGIFCLPWDNSGAAFIAFAITAIFSYGFLLITIASPEGNATRS